MAANVLVLPTWPTTFGLRYRLPENTRHLVLAPQTPRGHVGRSGREAAAEPATLCYESLSARQYTPTAHRLPLIDLVRLQMLDLISVHLMEGRSNVIQDRPQAAPVPIIELG